MFSYGIVDSHPPLIEVDPGAKVAQHEHTIIVRDNGVIDLNA